jgi:hypothetical protein
MQHNSRLTIFVERRAGIIPPAWFNFTRFHGVLAPNHAWRDFVVRGPTKKQARFDSLNSIRLRLAMNVPNKAQIISNLSIFGCPPQEFLKSTTISSDVKGIGEGWG